MFDLKLKTFRFDTTMPVTICTIADTAELTLLVNKSYRGDSSKRGWTTEAHLLSGNRIDEETMCLYLNTPNVTILKYTDDTETIQACVYLEDKNDKLYLGMLSVNPELQAGGIGRQLLAAADVFASEKNLPLILITVISTRVELIAWYERRGFSETGVQIPFHVEEKFGVPNAPIVLIEMQKHLIEK